MSFTIGQHLKERYRIDDRIGEGGFGAVYRAWDLMLSHTCAVKENLSTGAELRRQFQREALLLANLRHPNLPRVTDYFSIEGQGQYLVMDFVEGLSLDEILTRLERPLTEREALSWIEQVCQALSYLHSQNPPIIHRDIKPQNVIITRTGQAMLVDFGIAKMHDNLSQTTVGARAVTAGFSPPEQYGQGRTDIRSDIYSLGATLYTLLTKHSPPDAIDRLVHGTALPSPRNLNPRLSPVLEQAILKATAVAANERFPTIEEFRRSLTHPARPKRPAQPVEVKSKRMNWLGALVTGFLMLVVAGGVLLVAALFNRMDPSTPQQVAATLFGQSTPATGTPVLLSSASSEELEPPEQESSASFAVALNDQGIEFYDQGKLDDAINSYTRAIQLNPNFAEAYYNRGLAFFDRGDYILSINDYSQTIQLKPDHPPAYFGRALAYQMRKLRDQAILDYQKFLELNEDPKLEQKAEEQLELLRGDS